jgi:hypothetical protein
MPTKWFYVHAGQPPTSPFTGAYSSDGACESIANLANAGVLHNRESTSAGPPEVGLGLPSNPNDLCFAAESLEFGNVSVVASASRLSQMPLVSAIFEGTPFSYPNGWMDLSLDTESAPVVDADPSLHHKMISAATRIIAPDGTVTNQTQAIYFGLPVLGSSLASYFNGTLTDADGRAVWSSFISGSALHGVARIQ